jgi:hypothetical protein
MGRPIKEGLDYFPLDVELDDKFEIIESEFGTNGFGVVVKLLMRIYGQHGYYTVMTEREQKLFAKRINVDINEVNAIIMLALSEHLFDKEIFDKFGILTSRGIQKRYIEAAGRRKNIEFEKNILLIDISKLENVSVVNVNINPINDYIMSTSCKHDDYISTQRKVEESKEDQIKDIYTEGSSNRGAGEREEGNQFDDKDKDSLSGYINKNTGNELTIEQFVFMSNSPQRSLIVKKEDYKPGYIEPNKQNGTALISDVLKAGGLS